jgi:outer membrane protein assembly factor BamB
LWSLFQGGVVLEAEPSGKIVWEYYHPDHHHDARRLRNDNTMVLCIEKIPSWLVPQVKGGVPGTEINGDMYADVLYEVNPAGEIIWTWHAWEHLDTETDIILLQEHRQEWTHANTVDELSDGNIVACFRNISTVMIIDRQTRKIVWKLGYNVLAQPHVPNELPNKNLLIFDNGQHRQNEAVNYSRVIEIDRQTKEIVWEYKDDPAQNFYSPYLSGAQRLPNGNTLITEGSFGRMFEVTTATGEVVWEYVSPYFGKRTVSAETKLMCGEYNSVFRAFRYAPEEIPWL